MDEYSSDFILKDFKKRKESDQIIITGNDSNSALSDIEYEELKSGTIKLTVTCGTCRVTQQQKSIIDRKIYLEGVTAKEVEEWVEVATLDPDDENASYTDPKTGEVYTGDKLEKAKLDNPIQIK
jgi:hypothetical protein